ncbi:MAG: hypothetical protein JWO96_308 [Candidatus Saccharibacteria bacterium]|nr:hypothetical protein [Candidatus Saccharibacteria bacterium]
MDEDQVTSNRDEDEESSLGATNNRDEGVGREEDSDMMDEDLANN